MLSKVVEVSEHSIKFDTGHVLTSEHERDCCEHHYLSFADLDVDDFEGKLFDLHGDEFFERVEDYGIRLIPVGYGTPVPVPGYGENNGYYSSNLKLSLVFEGQERSWDIEECQVISG